MRLFPLAFLNRCIFLILVMGNSVFPQDQIKGKEAYLTWTEKVCKRVAKQMRVKKVSWFGRNPLKTDRSVGYKMRATWLTPEVIRASARIAQLREYFSDEEVRNSVAEAEAAGDTVFFIEIDPDEGSGVIPREWSSSLRPGGSPQRREVTKNSRYSTRKAKVVKPSVEFVRGVSLPKLRKVKALSGVFKRDYDYQVFWVVFPLLDKNGEQLFPATVREAQLVVRVFNREVTARFLIPNSIRARSAIASKNFQP